MSVNYALSIENSRLQLVANAIDAGGANGVMRLLDGSGNILSSLPLARPCGSVAADYLTLAGMSLIDPSAGGTGAALGARVEDSTGTTVISGLTVGTAGTDIILSPTNFIKAGHVIAIQQATIKGN